MKQSAVEWFYQRILAKDIKEVFEQAKEMEKEQQDEFAIQVLEFYHNGLFFIPLKDGEATEILNYIKKQKGL
jgi:hypothetical protein